jgi:hypothetical protein
VSQPFGNRIWQSSSDRFAGLGLLGASIFTHSWSGQLSFPLMLLAADAQTGQLLRLLDRSFLGSTSRQHRRVRSSHRTVVSPVPLMPHHARRSNPSPTRTVNDRASRVRLAMLPFRSSTSTSYQVSRRKDRREPGGGPDRLPSPGPPWLKRRRPGQPQGAPRSGWAQARILPRGAMT